MINLGKWDVLGNLVSACDYDFLLREILTAVKKKKSLYISPTTSHILARSVGDRKLKASLDGSNFLIPDSQWVKRSLYFLHGVRLKKRVYGPELVNRALALAEKNELRIFLYGTRASTLTTFKKVVSEKYSRIKIVGAEPGKPRPISLKERRVLIHKLMETKTNILFVGLGSELQDNFSYDLLKESRKSNTPFVVIPAGAAFDFIAKIKPQAPGWMMKMGLEWAFRLAHEPKRLWKRYLIYGPLFLFLIIRQRLMELKMKNLIRKILAALILTLFSPLILVIGTVVVLDSKGPVFFKQKRLGKNKKTFSIYKFRTMKQGSEKLQAEYKKLNEADGPVFKMQNDPRFTKFGKILALSALDELPQLINIIRGDMDFVGPRPLPVQEALKIPQKYEGRFSILPGITSSWITHGAHSLKFSQWMELDLQDVSKKNLVYDSIIIISTINLIIQGLFTNAKKIKIKN